jgi:transposase
MSANGSNGGRPTKLTEELIETIAISVQLGCSYETAAAAAGVARSTFNVWLRKGKNGEGTRLQRKLIDRIETAAGLRVQGKLAQINQAAQAGDWKAAAWILERIDPDQFAQTQRVHGQIAHEHRVTFDLAALDDVELAAGVAAIRKALEAAAAQNGDLLQLPRGETG